MDIVAETNSQIDKYDFYSKVMDRTDGHFTIDQIETETGRQIKTGFLQLSEGEHYLARTADRQREKLVEKELQKGHLKSGPFISEATLEAAFKGTRLKDDQKAAIRLFTRHTSVIAKIQGDAGTGKTTALETAVPLIQAAGYKVIGLSTTGESTGELEKTGVFDKVMTLQKYLLVPQGDNRTVLVVDESSMIGTKQMLGLLRYTNKKQMPRVLFLGDGNQMPGVQAGEPFKHMEKAGVRSVIMNKIIRQKDVRHRKGISQLTQADLKSAFETLAPEIHQVDAEKMIGHAIEAWKQTENEKTPIIVQTNKQKATINASIKAEHVSAHPNANHLTLKTWQPVYKNDAEKAFVRSYSDATHIRFNRDYKRFGIERGNIYKIEDINEEQAELTLTNNGQQRTFRPSLFKMGKGAVELYRQEERTLHEGDRIRFTRGGKMQPVNKNETATIKAIKDGKVLFEKDRGKPLTLSLKDNAIRHVDHAWASTTHAFQGKTVDHAVVVMPSRKSPLTTLESLYTSASRHRFTVAIITDDAFKLKRNIARAIAVDRIEAEIKWPEPPAPEEKETLIPAEQQKPALEKVQNIKTPEKSVPSSKEPKLVEPVIAKSIIERIRNEAAKTKQQEPKQEIQRDRSRGR